MIGSSIQGQEQFKSHRPTAVQLSLGAIKESVSQERARLPATYCLQDGIGGGFDTGSRLFAECGLRPKTPLLDNLSDATDIKAYRNTQFLDIHTRLGILTLHTLVHATRLLDMADKLNSFEDNLMPRSTIRNCAKAVLKADAPIQKEALLALTKASTVFISYLTAQANEIAISRKRKTIMPIDVFEALKVIEFERFVDDLKNEHEEQDALRKEKRNQKKPMEEDTATQASQAEDGTQSKKPRLEEEADRDDAGNEDPQSDTDEEAEAEGNDDENENDDVDDADDADETLVADHQEDISTRVDRFAGEANAESEDSPGRDALDYDEALDNGDESD